MNPPQRDPAEVPSLWSLPPAGLEALAGTELLEVMLRWHAGVQRDLRLFEPGRVEVGWDLADLVSEARHVLESRLMHQDPCNVQSNGLR